ncbi:MAG: hypothetical protein GXP53_07865 [Deltaproteobacteria bacterium]|nr:hypothetical protein [Deltaproteobacteria bacterium]
MTSAKKDIKQLHNDMEHVLNDAEFFLKDLKGQARVKKMFKKDAMHLRDHLQRLIDHLNDLSEEYEG